RGRRRVLGNRRLRAGVRQGLLTRRGPSARRAGRRRRDARAGAPGAHRHRDDLGIQRPAGGEHHLRRAAGGSLMTTEIPGAVQWLVPIVVGADWPEGDEDALRRLAEAWIEAGSGLDSAIEDAEAAVNAALQCMQGQTSDAFRDFGGKLTSDEELLCQLRDLCEQLGESCDGAAAEIEYTTLSIIAALIILAAQIAAMVAAAAATFGGSTAGIPAAQMATQLTVREIIQQLLVNIAKNIAQSIVVNVGL